MFTLLVNLRYGYGVFGTIPSGINGLSGWISRDGFISMDICLNQVCRVGVGVTGNFTDHKREPCVDFTNNGKKKNPC